MGKKKTADSGHNVRDQPSNFQNKDAFQKMNFLYQASHAVMGAGSQNVGIARYYLETVLAVRKRLVLKLNADLKKSICKRCHSLLLPGQTAKFRLHGKGKRYMVVTCLQCQNIKRSRTDRLRTEDFKELKETVTKNIGDGSFPAPLSSTPPFPSEDLCNDAGSIT